MVWWTLEVRLWLCYAPHARLTFCHYVCLRKVHRMMYNLTYLGHLVTLPWLDLRSNFDLELSRSNYTWFDAPWRDKHDGIKIVALPLQLKILSSKNRFGKFWKFDPWWPQFWPEPKNDRNDFEMIFRELSNAVFRFVLRCAGAEIDGGGVQTPPPAGGGKSRGPAGRGLKNDVYFWKRRALSATYPRFTRTPCVHISSKIPQTVFEQCLINNVQISLGIDNSSTGYDTNAAEK